MLAITAAQFSPVLQAGTRVLGRSFWGPPEPGRARASPFQRRLVADLQIGARVLGENTSFIPTSFQFYAGRAGTGAPFHFHGDAINLAAYGRCGRPVSAMPRCVASRGAPRGDSGSVGRARAVLYTPTCAFPLAHSHLRSPACAVPAWTLPLAERLALGPTHPLASRSRSVALPHVSCQLSCVAWQEALVSLAAERRDLHAEAAARVVPRRLPAGATGDAADAAVCAGRQRRAIREPTPHPPPPPPPALSPRCPLRRARSRGSPERSAQAPLEASGVFVRARQVPTRWAHAVLNVRETVGVALELSSAESPEHYAPAS